VLANLQRQLILSFGLFILLILAKADKIRPLLFSILLVSLVYVDLTWAHKSFLFPLHPDRVSQFQPVIEPSESRLTRFFYYPSARDLHPAFFNVMGSPTFEQAVALSFQNYLPNVGILRGFDYFQEIDALGRRAYNEFLSVANGLDFAHQLQLLRTFNVGYVVSFRELAENNIRLVGHFPRYFSWLYRIDGTVPRAFVVNRGLVEKETVKALQRLSSADFDPLREVVLQQDVSIRSTRALEAQAKIQSYENSFVAIQATTNQDSILVLADSIYPGWKAKVDGRETKILRANHFYRAVVLPKGEHRVEFRYEPQSFKLGVIISAFTLTSMAVVSLCLCLRRRKFAAKSSVSPIQILQH